MKKAGLIKIISLIATLCVVVCAFASCTGKVSKNAIVLENEKGKVVGEVDRELMSLIISVTNSNFGADSYAENDTWSTTFPGSDKTVKDFVATSAKSYAKELLQTEYLCDSVYGEGLSDEHIAFVENYVSEIATAYGGVKELENTLSAYGTDIDAFERYMMLALKRVAVYQALYNSENGIRRAEIQSAKKKYFEENYIIEDHILIKYSGGLKDDGTEIPLSAEEKAAKSEAAKSLYAEIENGARSFDDALVEFGEDTYILGFPFGYFIHRKENCGLPSEVQTAVREMKVGEIRFVDTQNGAYIVRVNPMNSELYKSNGDFDLLLESQIAQDDFYTLCEGAGTIVVNEEILSELDPENIPEFNNALLGQVQ